MEYGLIGEHLGHSYSKEIHQVIADYEYELKEIAPEDIDAFMKAKDFKAINVTIPYKQTVIPYLDQIDPAAAAIGAVNTIVNKDGRLYGYNTDFAGMNALADRLGLDFKGKKVLICGTGGTSLTARAVAKERGAGEVYRLSRGEKEGTITYEAAVRDHRDAAIIINTTPSGMFPKTEGIPIDLEEFEQLEGVMDAVYNPLRTNLILKAQARKIPAEGGLYMLSAQAVVACGHFLDREVSPEEIEKAFKHVAAQKKNIVLTGMPSCGKTTVGNRLAERLGRELIDTDQIFEKNAGMKISEFVSKYGEKAFRDGESEAVKEAAGASGAIIATGGGAVLRSENINALKHDGIIVFIDRPLEMLITTDDRPFSSSRRALEQRFNERYGIYRGTCDAEVDGSLSIDEVAGKVIAAAGIF